VNAASLRNGAVGEEAEDLSVPELLARMRDGDRRAAALFVTRYESRIRRRIRGKLNPAMRRIFDSQEILSTLGRRLDQYVQSGRVEASNEGELWALVFRMAEHAIIDKARVFRRLREVEDEDGPVAQELARRLRQASRERPSGAEIEIGNALDLFDNRIDRQILYLWLVGTGHNAIAEHVEMTPAAVRKRWQRIRAALQRRFAAEAAA
jgi:DNA-directed RNA polymerase specialized sigma24 family protein